jgi:hypothetical protein
MHSDIGTQAENGRAALARMGQRLVPRRHHRIAINGSNRHRSIVDDAVDDHLGASGFHRDRVGRDLGDLPGELILPLKPISLRVNPGVMDDHATPPLTLWLAEL